MINDDAIARIDKQVVTNLLKAANLSDIGIDLDALLGKKTNESPSHFEAIACPQTAIVFLLIKIYLEFDSLRLKF